MPLTQMQLLNLHITLALPSHAPIHHHKCCPLLIDLLIVQVQHLEFQMDKANSAWLEQDFIDARNQDQSVTTSDFHKQLTVGALLLHALQVSSVLGQVIVLSADSCASPNNTMRLMWILSVL